MRPPPRRRVHGLPGGALRGRQRVGAASRRLRPEAGPLDVLPSPQRLLERLRPSLGVRYPAFDTILDRAAPLDGAVRILVETAEDRADLTAAGEAFQGALWAEIARCVKTEDAVDPLDLTQTVTAAAILFGVWLGQSGRATIAVGAPGEQ